MKISPTMLFTWEQDPGLWIKTYVGFPRDGVLVKEREKQNEAMAAGSAFDSFVKARLAKDLLGEDRGDLFERSVDPINWDFGRRIGAYTLDEYIRLGAYDSIRAEIEAGEGLFMEERVDGVVDGIEISGRPDLFFYKDGYPVILDWKVSQILKDKPTVAPGYSNYRGFDIPVRNGARHPRSGEPLPDLLPRESTQLTFYGWLCGAKGEIIGGIDRLAGKPIRVISYRGMIGESFQAELRERIKVAHAGMLELVNIGEHYLQMVRDGKSSEATIEMILKSGTK